MPQTFHDGQFSKYQLRIYLQNGRYEILMAVTTMITMTWDVTWCGLVDQYQHLGETCCHLYRWTVRWVWDSGATSGKGRARTGALGKPTRISKGHEEYWLFKGQFWRAGCKLINKTWTEFRRAYCQPSISGSMNVLTLMVFILPFSDILSQGHCSLLSFLFPLSHADSRDPYF